MVKKSFIIFLIIINIFSACMKTQSHKNMNNTVPSKAPAASENSNDDSIINVKRDILCLMMAYPGYVSGVEKKEDGFIYIKMKSGTKILYDDKKKKNNDERILNADIQDMMEQIYPLGYINCLMDENFDPGRARCYAFLKAVYGQSKEQILKNLTYVKTSKGNFQFNKNNNASNSLKNVIKQLEAVSQKNQKVKINAFPVSGTFNYRNIAGTGILSAHSFGIAIDLAVNKNDYWRWADRNQGQKRIQSYPNEIVSLFEDNNFIWGGKWGHFDIMHYEYRPEIIYKAKYFGKNTGGNEKWYYGVPYDDLQIKNYIDIIEKAIN